MREGGRAPSHLLRNIERMFDEGAARRSQEVTPSPRADAIDAVEVPLPAVIGLIDASTGRLVQLVAQARVGSGRHASRAGA